MAAAVKEIALVTGANSGIGFELVHQLLAKGTYHVLLGSRSIDKGTAALKDLQSRGLPGSVELLQLDVQDDDSINQAVSSVTRNHGKLNLLVNNAGIALPTGTDREQLKTAFDINAIGPYVLTKALSSLLRQSTNARIINISSGAGSINRRLDKTSPMYKAQGVPYRASKAAQNMITACQFVEYGEMGIKVWAYDPGFTVSNLSENNRAERGARSADRTVWGIMEVVEGKRDGEVGKFLHNTGVYPW